MSDYSTVHNAGYHPIDPEDAVGANRHWWNKTATQYLTEHGEYLGDRDLLWCPEGLRESDAQLLGNTSEQDILEIGAGSAQSSRWLMDQGARVIATDIAETMLGQLHNNGPHPPCIAADGRKLPFADGSFDTVFTAYGVLPFVESLTEVHREVHRVLRPHGRWVFSVTHPIRWSFLDDPGVAGLTVKKSYFDRTPYCESDESGQLSYAEFHHTMGDHIQALTDASFTIIRCLEPSWPDSQTQAWDGWSPLRGRLIPGTVIFCCERTRLD